MNITKFHCFFADLAHGEHDFSSDDLAIYLSNSAPNAATHTEYDGTTGTTGPAEIAAGNGYTAGGIDVTVASSGQTSGAYTLALDDPAAITASGGSFGPFRYLIFYNKFSGRLIGYYDRGAAMTIQAGQQYRPDFDQINGVIKLQ